MRTKNAFYQKEGDCPLNIDIKVNPTYIQYMDKPQYTQIFFGG